MKTSIAALSLVLAAAANAAITGNPLADGWTYQGSSLANGTYVRGEATFSFDIYSTTFNVQSGSNLHITDGAYSWLPGDRVLAMGGKFVPTTAAASGWTAFDPVPPSGGGGTNPNDDISGSSRPVAKFGTATNIFSPSTTAPFAGGNGNGSDSAGHGGDGAIMLRITANAAAGAAGTIDTLDLAHRYDALGAFTVLDARLGRFAFTYGTTFVAGGSIETWETMLNLSLLARVSAYATYPTPGDDGIMSVQRGTNRFTDGLIVVPAPGAFALMGLGGLLAARRRR